MDSITLQVSERNLADKASHLRNQKLVPLEVYGHGFDNLHLQADYQTFRRTFEKATYSTIINLEVDGKDAVPVLVQDVQYHPVSDDILHADLHAIRMDEEVHTTITLEFVGDSEAAKIGAILSTKKHEVEVKCLPKDLVNHIEVDISALQDFGDVIRISDLTIPAGITVLDNDEDPVMIAVEPSKAVEPESTEGEGGEAAEGEAGEEGAENTEGAAEKEE